MVELGPHPVRVASLDHIIESKEGAGRPEDQRVLPILREQAAKEAQRRRRTDEE